MNLRTALLLLPCLWLAACSTLETLPLVSDLPKVPVPDVLRIENTVDAPRTSIERALSQCDKRTEAGETACVKAALASSSLGIPALAGSIGGGCRVGQVCHLAYTTEDVVGLYRPSASHFIVHWRVDVDLRHPTAGVGAVPVSVVQV
ncbi:hypothetical protein P7D22_06870 [Lichenihabitans sp. Uapishka_5]|uniref:hypothetical protein n=1 Tax=Lichenihabitans sp. Uapishka_5 TaxID=3037302 RepID=UPI0029E81F8C|nr:hypothetical protein [Lichenihabitans sp. Uapishka_5]MDX7950899.1 hypothetical protein [Lichenihabitans sp. Uapishka_5]